MKKFIDIIPGLITLAGITLGVMLLVDVINTSHRNVLRHQIENERLKLEITRSQLQIDSIRKSLKRDTRPGCFYPLRAKSKNYITNEGE